jgi:hypothetical protein
MSCVASHGVATVAHGGCGCCSGSLPLRRSTRARRAAAIAWGGGSTGGGSSGASRGATGRSCCPNRRPSLHTAARRHRARARRGSCGSGGGGNGSTLAARRCGRRQRALGGLSRSTRACAACGKAGTRCCNGARGRGFRRRRCGLRPQLCRDRWQAACLLQQAPSAADAAQDGGRRCAASAERACSGRPRGPGHRARVDEEWAVCRERRCRRAAQRGAAAAAGGGGGGGCWGSSPQGRRGAACSAPACRRRPTGRGTRGRAPR